MNPTNNGSTSTSRGVFTLPNGSEIELLIDKDGSDTREDPIDYRPMEGNDNEQGTSEGSSEHKEDSSSESSHTRPSEQEEGPPLIMRCMRH